jgi:hypothetical protein
MLVIFQSNVAETGLKDPDYDILHLVLLISCLKARREYLRGWIQVAPLPPIRTDTHAHLRRCVLMFLDVRLYTKSRKLAVLIRKMVHTIM